jgi:hypothetical protein
VVNRARLTGGLQGRFRRAFRWTRFGFDQEQLSLMEIAKCTWASRISALRQHGTANLSWTMCWKSSIYTSASLFHRTFVVSYKLLNSLCYEIVPDIKTPRSKSTDQARIEAFGILAKELMARLDGLADWVQT